MRTLFLFSVLVMLGAGCAPASAPISTPTVEEKPSYANNGNCTASGGTPYPEGCECPDGYAPDPAGFCLDAEGRPGGTMQGDSK